ncbi:DUF6622 family protein [Massilia sp. CF038]|uniref:DUF6622 family protein n=1 Tax=Massilia sp. CF038 TaxID=1881045 RepID=UPI000912C082|nr:DUF6622 family protein [Massilia sp. CF038]SHH09052.1 hypothetical protein SAMN05428948_2721 [Massilia sp. CF038]
MLQQILTNTPVYVWAILAFLVLRGVIAMRDREISIGKLFIIPVIMLALALQSIVARFGVELLPLAAWTAGAACLTVLVFKFGGTRLTSGSTAGLVLVRGSFLPFALMMAIFLTKYVTAIVFAVQPQASQNPLFVALVCALLGIFNGCLLGRLASDLRYVRNMPQQAKDGTPASAAA